MARRSSSRLEMRESGGGADHHRVSSDAAAAPDLGDGAAARRVRGQCRTSAGSPGFNRQQTDLGTAACQKQTSHGERNTRAPDFRRPDRSLLLSGDRVQDLTDPQPWNLLLKGAMSRFGIGRDLRPHSAVTRRHRKPDHPLSRVTQPPCSRPWNRIVPAKSQPGRGPGAASFVRELGPVKLAGFQWASGEQGFKVVAARVKPEPDRCNR